MGMNGNLSLNDLFPLSLLKLTDGSISNLISSNKADVLGIVRQVVVIGRCTYKVSPEFRIGLCLIYE